MDQKESFFKAAVFIKAFGKPCLTTLQAKKLESLGLSYEDLTKLLQETGGGEAFHNALKDIGINSKLLREKLGSSLSSAIASISTAVLSSVELYFLEPALFKATT